MRIKGIIWAGTATEERIATTDFFADLLGMDRVLDVRGFSRLRAENGDLFEIFGPESIEHDHLDTGPVAGFWVDDVEEAHKELVAAGVEEVTVVERAAHGHGWFYFKAPDGRFYELCERREPRPAKVPHSES